MGTEGALLVGGLEGVAVTSVRADAGVQQPTFPSWRDRFRTAYVDEDRHFVQRILDGAEPMSGPEDGRRALEVVLAANESIRTGMAVALLT